jgi:hypothetical protein
VYIFKVKKTCLLERELEATEGQADSTKTFLHFKERIEVLIKFHLLSFCLIFSTSHFFFLMKFPKKNRSAPNACLCRGMFDLSTYYINSWQYVSALLPNSL